VTPNWNFPVRPWTRRIYRSSRVWVKKSPPPAACGCLTLFDKRLRILYQFFTHLLYAPIYARLQIFIQLPQTLTNLCHIKRDYLVHVICSKCPQSAETHAFRRLRKSLIALLIVVSGKSSQICCFYNVIKHVGYDMTSTADVMLSKQTYKLSSSEMSKIRWVVSLTMA